MPGVELAASRKRRMRCSTRHLPVLPVCLASLVVALVPGGPQQQGAAAAAADSLRISSIQVPSAVANSSQVTLACHYELPRFDQLYSIKWYKNFVEFYRYQPSLETSSTSASSQESQWKQEFKWAGINLDLAQSNSTHVHLQRVTLASEGTYKCEVSTQLFATTSMERDMKVYVLPKQKLSIVDNNAVSRGGRASRQLNHSPDQQAPPPARPTRLIYNINDHINLTCISGPSKPAAQLRWLFNQAPIEADSKWLTYHQTTSSQLGLNPDQNLVESKLTLTFQLHPNHLTRTTNHKTPDAHHLSGQQQLKLSCISLLSVSFSRETDVSLSGSRSTSARLIQSRHQQNSLLSPLPLPSSLQASGGQSQVVSSLSDKQTQASTELHTPRYRWPQPRPNQSASARFSTRNRQPTSSAQADTPDNQDQTSSDELVIRPEGQQPTVLARGQPSRVSLWNSRELKAQADFIDLIQRSSRPNELEAPQVEARSIAMNDEQSYDSNAGIFATPKVSADSAANGGPSTASGPLNGDYQLNDRVQFTCKPRVVQLNEANLTKSIYSVWFLNNKEIYTASINGFDGNNFYHSTSPQEAPRVVLNQSPSNSFNLNGHSAQVSQFSNNSDKWWLNNKPQQTNGPLTIELTPSIFQLQELNLRCKTRVEQPLIEFEHQVVVQVPPTKFIQSNSRTNQPYPKNYIPSWNINIGNKKSKKRIHFPSSGCGQANLKNLIVSYQVVVLLISWSILTHLIVRL